MMDNDPGVGGHETVQRKRVGVSAGENHPAVFLPGANAFMAGGDLWAGAGWFPRRSVSADLPDGGIAKRLIET